jgi:hypothetical protein
MACSILVHIKGTTGKDYNWKPGEIIVVKSYGFQWSDTERAHFLPVDIEDATMAELLELQGRESTFGVEGYDQTKSAVVDWESMFTKDSERAAVRNRDIPSPRPDKSLAVKSKIATVWMP